MTNKPLNSQPLRVLERKRGNDFFLYRRVFLLTAHVCKEVNSFLLVEGRRCSSCGRSLSDAHTTIVRTYDHRVQITPPRRRFDGTDLTAAQTRNESRAARPSVIELEGKLSQGHESRQSLEAEPHSLEGISIILVVSYHEGQPCPQ